MKIQELGVSVRERSPRQSVLRPLFFLFLLAFLCRCVDAQPKSESPDPDYPFDGNYNPATAVIIVVVICAFFFMGLFTIVIRHCSDLNEAAAPAMPSRYCGGLDPDFVATFPILVYSAVKDLKIGKGALECAVCLSEFEDDDTLRLLPKCDHVFHPDCIDAWLAAHVTCPVCRAMLAPESEPTKLPDQSDAPRPAESSWETDAAATATPEVITVEEDQQQSREEQAAEICNVASAGTPRRNRHARARVSGKFPRSHSTGHSLVQPGENTERYTLRLPEEVRRQLVISAGKLKRTRSYDVVLWSRKGGGWSWGRGAGEGSSRGKSTADRWVFSMTPPFVSKAASAKSPKSGGDGEASTPRTFLTSVKVPLDCLSARRGAADPPPARPPV